MTVTDLPSETVERVGEQFVYQEEEHSPMRCVEISGSDDRMDCRDMFYEPLNPLPSKCPKCGIPDLDYVPRPYFLVKSRTITPNELALAANGNFLVRQRARVVLDTIAPDQCTYFPTCYRAKSQETPWLLAVPNHQVVTAKIDPSIPRCDECGEPRSAHPGTQFTEYLFGTPSRGQPLTKGWTNESEFDVLKSSTWASSEKGWDQWISRDLFLSVRLLHLFKKVKIKGFYEATCGKAAAPDPEDSAWIDEKIDELEVRGFQLHAEGTLSNEDAKWLRDYIQTRANDSALPIDPKAVERQLRIKLPKSYIDFISKVGAVSFANVDEQEGLDVRLLPPRELDAASYRAGALDMANDEAEAVDGLMFATTDFGDCFCFDVQKGKKEFSVFVYKHEGGFFEPYAENFAAFIKRISGGGNS